MLFASLAGLYLVVACCPLP